MIEPKKVVCQIDETGYATIAAAIGEANGGETIKLVKDVTESIVFNRGLSLTLDLNGHSLTDSSDNSDTVNVYSNSTLTITDSSSGTKGSIISNAGSAVWTGFPMNSDTSKITIEGGVTLTGNAYGVNTEDCSTVHVIVNDASITGTNGAFSDDKVVTDNRSK